MKFLIVKCEPLDDQYECDANREPMFICDDWSTLQVDYMFEAYRINDDNTFTLVKKYDTPLEFGMALYSWDEEEPNFEETKPKVVKKWRNYTRDNPVPKKAVKEMSHKGVTELDDNLSNCGTITWFCDGRYWVYGEYFDSNYSLGF